MARADVERDFHEHYQRAMALYKEGLFRQSIKEFVAAYAINPLPRLLYNMAQLQRKIGEYQDAIEAYELYLRTESDLSDERKAEVRRYLDALSEAAPKSTLTRVNASKDPNAPILGGSSNGDGAPPPLLALPPEPALKAGAFMVNVALGYGLPVYAGSLSSGSGTGGFTLRTELGYSVLSSRNGYIFFAPDFELHSTYGLVFPVGFQYDFPVIVRGLFFYARGSLGYAIDIPSSGSGGSVTHFGVFTPEAGIKYVLRTRVNFGFELFGLPIWFNTQGASISYRLLFSGGVNF
jgi:tetratricopeptide (TPR) repeat protein